MTRLPMVEHPHWCDRVRCSAVVPPTPEEYRAAERPASYYGRHASAPAYAGGVRLTVWQMVCPWPTSSYVELSHAGERVHVPVDDLQRALAELGLGGRPVVPRRRRAAEDPTGLTYSRDLDDAGGGWPLPAHVAGFAVSGRTAVAG